MAVDQSEITSMNETQTPSGDSKVFINNNGEFEQCELDKLMEATELSKKVSDVNTSLNDIKNTLKIQDISDTVTKSEFVDTLVLKKQGNHVFGYVRYKNIPPQTPLLDNLPKTLTLHFYSVFEYNTGYPANASLWQSNNQVIAYGEQSTTEYGGFIDYICV